jgi:hypothetical protein
MPQEKDVASLTISAGIFVLTFPREIPPCFRIHAVEPMVFRSNVCG